MKRKLLHWTLGITISLGLMVLIAFNLLIVWVATGPRSLKTSLPYIEKQIASTQNHFNVTVGDGVLLWDGWQHPFDIRLKDVRIATREGVSFATFPELSVGADIIALLTGRFMPNSVRIANPSMVLERQVDGSLTFGFGQEYKAQISTPEHPFTSPDNTIVEYGLKKSLSFLDLVEISDAIVVMTDLASGKTYTVHNADIRASRDFYKITASIRANLSTEENVTSTLYAQGSLPLKSLAATIKAQATNVDPSLLTFISPIFAAAEGLKVPVSGTVEAKLTAKGKLDGGSAQVTLGKGAITTKLFDTPMVVDSGNAELVLIKNTLEIHTAEIMSKGRRFAAKGKIWNTDVGTGVELIAEGIDVPVDDVHELWPVSLAPMTREWAVANITHGNLPRLKLITKIQPGDIAKPFLPAHAIDSYMAIENAEIHYKPGHPKVTNMKGIIRINAKSLTVDIASAHTLESTALTAGKVTIDDLTIDNPHIDVNFNINSPGADVARYLALPDMNFATSLNVTSESLKGNFTGKVSVGFDYFAPRDAKGNIIEDEIAKVAIDANLADVAAANFMKRFDLSHTGGNLTITNDKVTFKGTTQPFTSPDVSADLQYAFGGAMTLQVNGALDDNTLVRLGYAAKDQVKGNVGINATITENKKETKTEATLNFTNAALNVADLNWSKPVGVPATLNITTLEGEGDVVQLPNFDFSMKDVSVKGSAAFNASTKSLVSLTADTFKIGRNDLKLNYQPIPGGSRISASGTSADLKNYLEAEGEGTSLKNFPALDLNLNIATVYLAHDVVATNFKGTALCDTTRCTSANITGTTDGEKPFAIRIDKANGKRIFSAKSEDSGTFLKSLDIYTHMIGGTLQLEGTYADGQPGNPLSGNLKINTYRIKNAGALAKVLTLASFTGILDTLQGNEGIGFDRMRGKYTLSNDVITLENFRSIGDSLGIMLDGTIAIKARTMDLKGTVVPAYTFNSALKNVPIVGDILTGGEGIIAAVFTMRGPTKDPDVNVNPLSVLTPGFLRGIFE